MATAHLQSGEPGRGHAVWTVLETLGQAMLGLLSLLLEGLFECLL